jgi:excinuclease ABC subunit A
MCGGKEEIMEQDKIIIRGAKENNLKNIDLDIPRNKLVVMTGLSGSGKTSLAFDTIYAEGQRRYVESLSAYARQFLGGVEKPNVELIEGLSPAISIDQKTTSNNPRSTVGTVTEIYDYLRLLYARTGTPYCPNHNIPITGQTVQEMVDTV